MWIFEPILKETIWGGSRIPSFKRLGNDGRNIGESWEISGMPGMESIVAEGEDKGLSLSELIDKYAANIIGKRNYERYGTEFPLLVKFIDATRNLSVQVHPDDEIALRHGGGRGKTEMWYVIHADAGAKLANGFIRPITPDEYKERVENGSIMEALHCTDVKNGDVFYIPSGRVHTIGSGIFLLEIQQASDTTYRIFDYHRKDKDGKERQLHTSLALEAINFNDTGGGAVVYRENSDIPVNIVDCPFFTVNLLRVNEDFIRDYSERDSFIILVCTQGEAEVKTSGQSKTIYPGSVLLIGASEHNIKVQPKDFVTIVETYIK